MKRLLLIFAVAGTLAGLGISYFFPPKWRTTAALHIENKGNPDLLSKSVSTVMSRQSLANIVSDPRLELYVRERRNMPLEAVVDRMRRDTRIETMPVHPEVFTVQFEYSDPVKAVEATNILMSRLALAARGPGGTYITVVELPRLPTKPITPSRQSITLAGAASGLILGILTVLVRRRNAKPA